MADDVRDPPSAQAMRITGFGLIALGVLLYLFFGVFKGHPLDAGAFTMLAVPAVFGVGALMLGRSQESTA